MIFKIRFFFVFKIFQKIIIEYFFEKKKNYFSTMRDVLNSI